MIVVVVVVVAVVVVVVVILFAEWYLRSGVVCLAVGCASPDMVGMTLVHQNLDKATMRCNSTGRQWSVKCRESVWVPVSSDDEHHQRNCSASSLVGTSRGGGVGGRHLTASAAAGLAHHQSPTRVTTFPFSTSPCTLVRHLVLQVGESK